MSNDSNDQERRGYHEDPSVIQLHRAIGGYITVFSEVVARMRQQIAVYFEPESVEFELGNPLLDVLFSSMTAQPIVNSFFALSTHVGDLDETDLRIRNALRRAVNDEVSYRNDLAHADWSVGWVDMDTDEPVPPAAHKIKSQDGVPRFSNLGITTSDVIGHINELLRLRQLVHTFGGVCRLRQRHFPVRVAHILEVVPADPAGGTIVQFWPEAEALGRALDEESVSKLEKSRSEEEPPNATPDELDA